MINVHYYYYIIIIIWLCTASLCASGAALLSLENKHFIPKLGFTREKMRMEAPLPPACSKAICSRKTTLRVTNNTILAINI